MSARAKQTKTIVKTKKITFARNTNFNVLIQKEQQQQKKEKRKEKYLQKAIAETKTKFMYDIV